MTTELEPRSVSKPFRNTWLNRPATLVTLSFDRRRYGDRVSIMFWDDGEVEMTAHRGDGRTGSFRRYERQSFARVQVSDAEVYAAARQMAARHFA